MGIKKIVDQQFENRGSHCRCGLVPILEPEIDIYSPDKAESEQIMKDEIRKHLAELSEDTRLMFKLSIPDKHGFYSDLMERFPCSAWVALSEGDTKSGGYSLGGH